MFAEASDNVAANIAAHLSRLYFGRLCYRPIVPHMELQANPNGPIGGFTECLAGDAVAIKIGVEVVLPGWYTWDGPRFRDLQKLWSNKLYSFLYHCTSRLNCESNMLLFRGNFLFHRHSNALPYCEERAQGGCAR
jgi:hypothetical protein